VNYLLFFPGFLMLAQQRCQVMYRREIFK